MVATVVADLVAAAVLDQSIMTEKLARRGLRVSSDYSVDVLGMHSVADVMTTEVETLPSSSSIGEARGRFALRRHSAYPLVDDDGRCAGIVSRATAGLPGDGEPLP
ncbi:MAG TPA: CBS domain-containing protein [Acidimicrobiales bacterium]|nr:CBS domain-containing protein [Acidimicrobiales bacterium]